MHVLHLGVHLSLELGELLVLLDFPFFFCFAGLFDFKHLLVEFQIPLQVLLLLVPPLPYVLDGHVDVFVRS